MQPILVFGHKNPDNDSICSAVAYAYLRNQLEPRESYIPARLGPMPKETTWVFERYGIETPRAIPHVHTRVCDVMTAQVLSVDCETTLLEAGRMMREHKVRALVVNDLDGRFMGIISSRKLAELYVAETLIIGFTESPVTLGNLAKSFDGQIVVGEPTDKLSGRLIIGAGEIPTVRGAIEPGDAIVLGDRKVTQPVALDAGAACLILSCGATADDDIIEHARSKGAYLITTQSDSYTVARFGSLSHTVDDAIDSDALVFDRDKLLKEAAEELLASRHREGVVLDDDRRCIGIVTRSDIARSQRRRVVLVDHNERSQSAAGIDEAEVCGIVDHHRVADIQTSTPIQFLDLPLGSTATIVAREYVINDVPIPVPMAAIMLSAMMTDTLLLKSPTTTEEDRRVAERLGRIIERDPLEFGMDVIRSRGGDRSVKVGDIIGADAKEFRIGDNVVLVVQHETIDLDATLSREDEIRAAMKQTIEQRGYDIFLLMITDIVREGSQFICEGKRRPVERAFDISFDDGSVFMPGIVSRKKQVIGRLIDRSA